MLRRSWMGVVGFGIVLALALILGIRFTDKHPVRPPSPPTKNKVISDVRHAQNEFATDIHVIHLATKKSEGFAFTAFVLKGSQKYGSLIISPGGYSMSTTSFDTNATQPIQETSLAADGFEYITGKVTGHFNIKSVIIIFTNGTSVSVPTEKNYFWYERKAPNGSIGNVKQVIAVTDTGTLIQNKKP